MREVTEVASIEEPTFGNLTDAIESNALNYPNTAAISIPEGEGWKEISTVELRAMIRGVAKGLIASGFAPGERIAIFSRTRYEWTIADYAIWYAGCITVPIYETSSPSQVEWIMSDAQVVGTFFEMPRSTNSFDLVADKLPLMRAKFIFTQDALTELTALGAAISDDELDARRHSLTPESIATLIYTSGTTGAPKGCVLTHKNFMFEVRSLIAGFPEIFAAKNPSTLLFLPLAHVFARAIQVAFVSGRVLLAHNPNPVSLLKDLESFKPSFLLAVPRVFEKVFNGSRAKATDAGKGKIFDAASEVAIAYSEALDTNKVTVALRVKHAIFDKLVYSKLRAAMGGNVRYAISGGAALGARLGHFYRGIGIVILEGYGLTETTAGSTLNRPAKVKVGTVGRPIPGTSIKIAEDGEVLIRGHHIFPRYWNNEQASSEALSADGWFQSGDVGALDDEGYLTITGRKKEILVTAGGKNVAPLALEDRLRAAPIVSQCVVVGDAKPFIAALVTLDQEALPVVLRQHSIPEAPLAELVNNPAVRDLVQQAVNYANEAVSNSEAIKKFTILTTDWTVDNGYLTPKQSIKRHLINNDFADEIAALYS
jgi:long-chain acyl-CoA synthetase